MREFLGQGTLNLSVSCKVCGENEEHAFEKLIRKINDLNIVGIKVDVMNEQGNVNKLKTHDHEIEWEEITEIEEKKKPLSYSSMTSEISYTK